MTLSGSVTRLGNIRKFLVAIFHTKIAQISGNILGSFANTIFEIMNSFAFFWASLKKQLGYFLFLLLVTLLSGYAKNCPLTVYVTVYTLGASLQEPVYRRSQYTVGASILQEPVYATECRYHSSVLHCCDIQITHQIGKIVEQLIGDELHPGGVVVKDEEVSSVDHLAFKVKCCAIMYRCFSSFQECVINCCQSNRIHRQLLCNRYRLWDHISTYQKLELFSSHVSIDGQVRKVCQALCIDLPRANGISKCCADIEQTD